MKLLLVALVSVSLTSAAPASEDGRYYHDDSGQYVHDPNEGRYIHDGTGNYNPDGSGIFRGDGSGRYSGQKDPRDQYKSGQSFGQGRGQFGSGNLLGSGTFQNVQKVLTPVVRPVPKAISSLGSGSAYGNTASGTSNIGVHSGKDGHWRILRQSGDHDIDGYHWEYLTENGINAEETGKLINKGTDRESMEAKGFFTYTGPDNVQYTVHYTADENGFQASGDHLPTPPPVPKAILRALDFQRSTGKL